MFFPREGSHAHVCQRGDRGRGEVHQTEVKKENAILRIGCLEIESPSFYGDGGSKLALPVIP